MNYSHLKETVLEGINICVILLEILNYLNIYLTNIIEDSFEECA